MVGFDLDLVRQSGASQPCCLDLKRYDTDSGYYIKLVPPHLLHVFEATRGAFCFTVIPIQQYHHGQGPL